MPLLCLLTIACPDAIADPVLRSTREFRQARATKTPASFDVTAKVTFVGIKPSDIIGIRDDSGAAIVIYRRRQADTLAPGDTVRLQGHARHDPNTGFNLYCQTSMRLSSGQPDPPLPSDISGLCAGKFDYQAIRFSGTVKDIVNDEVDPNFVHLVIDDGQATILTPVNLESDSRDAYLPLLNCKVEVSGICLPPMIGARQKMGRTVGTAGRTNFRILEYGKDSPFDVPPLDEDVQLQPEQLAALGPRLITGNVIAIWDRRRLLVRTARGSLLGVELSECRPPNPGSSVELVGFPATDLFHLNLVRALWRPGREVAPAAAQPRAIVLQQLFRNADGVLRADMRLHGQTVQIEGTVKTVANGSIAAPRFWIEDGDVVLPVDLSACPAALADIEPNSRLRLTGTCIYQTENFGPYCVIPSIVETLVAVKRETDIALLNRPPWWTPARLLVLVVLLLLVLAGIVIWNFALHSVLERKASELKREIGSRVSSNTKVRERTRLAVDLHDSIAQGLTGIALEINAARHLVGDPDQTLRHLDTASRSLRACRDEMQKCLWDLRNNTLCDGEIDEAIRRAVEPFLATATLAVRFNVPRRLFSDNTVHTVLRIVRELVINAVRHGHATKVYVAGSIEGLTLLLSVRDDGSGFDPEHCPGLQQGHFGLQGIRERVKRMNGRFAISSRPGTGTKATVSIQLPAGDNEDDYL